MRTLTQVKFVQRTFIILTTLLWSATSYAQNNFKILDQEALKEFGQQEHREISVKLESSTDISLDLSEENPVYAQILSYLNQNSDSIAQEQLDEIEDSGGFQAWGGLNHVGLSFSKGFGTFSIELQRQVAPDLFSDDLYIATDTFDIYIDASTILGELSGEGIIDITDAQMALFAGVTFKRSYTYVHYEESYEKALAFNLDKLFFSFLNFRSKNYLDIDQGDLLKKEDSLSFSAGGAGNVGVTTGLAAHLGFLVSYENVSLVTLQGILEDEQNYEGEFLRINSEKSSEFSAQLSAGVVADFLGVLQVSLLKYDFTYEATDSYSYALSFHEDDKEVLNNESDIGEEVSKVLKHKDANEDLLAPYTTSSEQRSELSYTSAYEILLFGGKKTADTTHYKITKDDVLHTFFAHSFKTSEYTQNIFSKLFNVILGSFVELTSVINNSEERSRSVVFQYKDERNLIESEEDLEVTENEEKISINFVRKYYAYKGTKSNRKEAVELLENFSGVDPLIIDEVEDGLLTSSLNFYSKYSMTNDAITDFNQLSVSEAYEVFDDLCDDGRSGIIGWFSSLLKVCERRMKKKYDLYQIEWSSGEVTSDIYSTCKENFKAYKKGKWFVSSRKKRLFMSACTQELAAKSDEEKARELPVWRLADFMDYFLKKSESKVYYFQLFGYDNVHVYGYISGQDSEENSYINYFSEGNFKGIDLISNFQKANGLKTAIELN